MWARRRDVENRRREEPRADYESTSHITITISATASSMVFVQPIVKLETVRTEHDAVE